MIGVNKDVEETTEKGTFTTKSEGWCDLKELKIKKKRNFNLLKILHFIFRDFFLSCFGVVLLHLCSISWYNFVVF